MPKISRRKVTVVIEAEIQGTDGYAQMIDKVLQPVQAAAGALVSADRDVRGATIKSATIDDLGA